MSRHNSLSIKARIATLKDEQNEALARTASTEKVIAEKDGLIERLEADIRAVDTKLSLTGDDLDTAEACIKELAKRVLSAETTAEGSERSCKVLEDALEKEQDLVKELANELFVLKMEQEEIENKYQGAIKQLKKDDIEDQIDELEKANEKILTNNNELETKLNEILRKNRMMEAEIVKVCELSEVLEGRQLSVDEELLKLDTDMKNMEASEVKSSEKDDVLEVVFAELREAKALLEVTVENGERQIQVLEENVRILTEELRLEREEHRLDKENLKELQDEILEIETDNNTDGEEGDVVPVVAAKIVDVSAAPAAAVVAPETEVDDVEGKETTSSYDSYSSSVTGDEEDI